MEPEKQDDKRSGKERTQFKKGQSGNPAGRPKKQYCIPDLLRKIGDEPASENSDMTKLEVVLRSIYKDALKGNNHARQFIADRTEGRPKQSLDITEFTAGKQHSVEEEVNERLRQIAAAVGEAGGPVAGNGNGQSLHSDHADA